MVWFRFIYFLMRIRKELKSDVVLKKGKNGWEAWQTNKLIAKVPGFSNRSKQEVMKHIPGYETVIESRYYQSAEPLYTLSECAQYLAALFFDLRTIHFLATGSEFYTYHKLAEELYEQTEKYYDDIIETALGYDSDVSPMYVLPGDWNFVDEHGSFDTNGQVAQTLLLERLQIIYDILECVQNYDSMVSSKIDSMLEYYDKEIYKLKQAME